MRSLAAVAAMGLMMAGDELLTGDMADGRRRRERQPVGPALPEKSGRKARLAEQAERRRARLSPTPPSTGAEK